MSLSLGLFLLLFLCGTLLSFLRPVYGLQVYLLTYFASPPYWWWGGPVASYRWSLYGGIVLLAAVIISRMYPAHRAQHELSPLLKRIGWIVAFMLLNATLVHLVLARHFSISNIAYMLMLKFVVLFFLIIYSIKDEKDLRLVLVTMIIGAAYIGFEVTLNERGSLQGSRLEGVGAPGAGQANELASLMVTILPIGGALLFLGRWWEKAITIVATPLILNVILLCNSRGAFLASLASAVVFIVSAPKRIRKHAIYIVCLGGFAAWFLMGDPQIAERFLTTFVDAEERDSSAQSRLNYWKAGFRMIGDHPLGAGGMGFKRVHGPKYIEQMTGDEHKARSVHNGFINDACEWGIQGLFLRLSLVFCTAWALLKLSRDKNTEFSTCVLASSLIACLGAFGMTCMFGDFLDAEWGMWICGLSFAVCCIGFVRDPSVVTASTTTPSQRFASRGNR